MHLPITNAFRQAGTFSPSYVGSTDHYNIRPNIANEPLQNGNSEPNVLRVELDVDAAGGTDDIDSPSSDDNCCMDDDGECQTSTVAGYPKSVFDQTIVDYQKSPAHRRRRVHRHRCL